jgi:tRNA(Ile)-lysidine synthase
VAWLDADAVPFPWILRRWRAGDRLRPIGTGGSKLVSDLLTDAKVDHASREKTLVLESEGRLMWLLGHRVDEEAAAKPGSRSIWRVEFLETHN